MTTIVVAILLTLSSSMALAQGRGNGHGHGKGHGRSDSRYYGPRRGDGGILGDIFGTRRYRRHGNKRKFVNGHDARDGRWDGKGPRRW